MTLGSQEVKTLLWSFHFSTNKEKTERWTKTVHTGSYVRTDLGKEARRTQLWSLGGGSRGQAGDEEHSQGAGHCGQLY